MHIMEGYLPAAQAAAWYAASAPFWVVSVRKTTKLVQEHRETLLLLGVAAGFCFVLSALKMPSVTGSSSHPTGMGLGSILFGPWPMVLVGIHRASLPGASACPWRHHDLGGQLLLDGHRGCVRSLWRVQGRAQAGRVDPRSGLLCGRDQRPRHLLHHRHAAGHRLSRQGQRFRGLVGEVHGRLRRYADPVGHRRRAADLTRLDLSPEVPAQRDGRFGRAEAGGEQWS